jgi:hypothetical protein
LEPTNVIAEVCDRLSASELDAASSLISTRYPFQPPTLVERKYGLAESLRVFIRDGFIDRYSGSRLVFPGTLRLIAHLLPVEFPFQSNWKMSETHAAFWQLTPTIDHVLPVCRGGADSEDNWLTTSMLRNSAKANWTVEELGWTIYPPGGSEWDGQLAWFKNYVAANPAVLSEISGIRSWWRAALDTST